MRLEPKRKRAVAFVDGQNLFHSAREAFGYRYPNYDVRALSRHVCEEAGWDLCGVRFYTGIPSHRFDPFWHEFWTRRLAEMGKQGIHVHARPLRRRYVSIRTATGQAHELWVSEEKGIDVRIAIDVIRLAHHRCFDVALLFSQDQDFAEVSEEIRHIAREQRRWIKIACAFPIVPGVGRIRGIAKTDWIHIDRATYDSCLDRRDYRPRRM